MTDKNTDIDENETEDANAVSLSVTNGGTINGLGSPISINGDMGSIGTFNAGSYSSTSILGGGGQNGAIRYEKGSFVFEDEEGKEVALNDLISRLNKIEERLSIIDKLTDEESVMLKSAYDEYKFVEKLIGKDNDSSES